MPETEGVPTEGVRQKIVNSSRQRVLDAIGFRDPDKIPVVCHGSPAGLHTHGQKLLDLFRKYPPDHPASFDSIPAPPAGTVDASGQYHEVKKDEWGTTWEYLIFGVWGHPKAYPFPDWAAARDFVIPPAPAIGSNEFQGTTAWVTGQKPNYFMMGGGGSLLEKPCALRPMDEVLMDLQDRNSDLLAFLDRLVEHDRGVIDFQMAAGFDAFMFGDDWGTQNSPVISPDLFREIFKPRYRVLFDAIRRGGGRVFFHSCGCLGPILDELFDLGISGLWPQIKFYDSDAFAARCKEHGVTIYIHPDRQHLVPRGTPQEIEAAIRRFADRYHRLGGGGIFYIEIENDAPFENVRTLIESVARYR